MKINFCDLKKQYELLKPEIDQRVASVMQSAWYIMGPELKELEERLAEYVGVSEAIGVSSGTDALVLALMALDVKPGDVVITTPFTFIATAEAIALLGAVPAFVDIDKDTYNICPKELEKYLLSNSDKNVKAVITVDLYGQCADYDEIKTLADKYRLKIIEDAAQAFGADYKSKKSCSLADIACTSFFPAKPLGCAGDGGAVFTDDKDLAEKIRMLLNHGQDKRYSHKYIGINGRLDAIQAAVLNAKFDAFVNKEIKLRNDVADKYTKALQELEGKGIVLLPKVKETNKSVWAQYSIQLLKADRESVQNKLNENGIPTAVHYPIPLSLQECFSDLGYKRGDFPVAEGVAGRIMSLPMHPYVSDEEIEYICNSLKEILK